MSYKSFQTATNVEQIAINELLPWLERQYAQVRRIDDSYALQKMGGDFLIQRFQGEPFFAELKAEQHYTGNLFFETWSNYLFNLGWLYSSHADALFYYFCVAKELIVLDFLVFKNWAFERDRIFRFPEKQQRRYEQRNDTRGRLVPIATLFQELPEHAIRRFIKRGNEYVKQALVIPDAA